jgi:hypothetical protein
MYAMFGCRTYREQCEAFQTTGVEAGESLGDICEAGFVDLLPSLGDHLLPCPGCGGPSELLEVLVPVTS